MKMEVVQSRTDLEQNSTLSNEEALIRSPSIEPVLRIISAKELRPDMDCIKRL
jgi:hypothetical protein